VEVWASDLVCITVRVRLRWSKLRYKRDYARAVGREKEGGAENLDVAPGVVCRHVCDCWFMERKHYFGWRACIRSLGCVLPMIRRGI
jgi:hypothetical protein